jgi:hypothetical protein
MPMDIMMKEKIDLKDIKIITIIMDTQINTIEAIIQIPIIIIQRMIE